MKKALCFILPVMFLLCGCGSAAQPAATVTEEPAPVSSPAIEASTKVSTFEEEVNIIENSETVTQLKKLWNATTSFGVEGFYNVDMWMPSYGAIAHLSKGGNPEAYRMWQVIEGFVAGTCAELQDAFAKDGHDEVTVTVRFRNDQNLDEVLFEAFFNGVIIEDAGKPEAEIQNATTPDTNLAGLITLADSVFSDSIDTETDFSNNWYTAIMKVSGQIPYDANAGKEKGVALWNKIISVSKDTATTLEDFFADYGYDDVNVAIFVKAEESKDFMLLVVENGEVLYDKAVELAQRPAS